MHILSSKIFVISFVLRVSVTAVHTDITDDDDELTKKIKERYKELCNSNLCRENPGKPVKEVFNTEDGYVTMELSCPKKTAEERQCLEGYHDNGDKCEDIDECIQISHVCSPDANCENTIGSFTCTCMYGYQGDGLTCSDIDECSDGSHNCSQDAICTNTKGSFDCACSDGYHGDGYTCKTCRSDWQHFNGSCYKYFNEQKSWDEAKTTCESYVANLSSIHSNKENSFIVNLSKTKVWIGLNDQTAEGTFTWVDGTPLDYTAWQSGQPDNLIWFQDCTMLLPNKGWDDVMCHIPKPYVCRYSL